MCELISVIVAIYNGEKYISECIESVLMQDYRNIELFLVDDGSTDRSGEILDEYGKKDARVHVYHQPNQGVSVARNLALENAHGEYLCFLDQDDYFAENYISYYYEMIKESGADIALTPTVRKVKSDEKLLGREAVHAGNFCCLGGVKAAEQMLLYRYIIAPWNKMIKRGLIENNQIRFVPGLFGGEGFLFSIQCFLCAKSVAQGESLVYRYRVDNPDSGMTKFSMEVQHNSINTQKLIRTYVMEKAPQLEKACIYANWHTHCDCLNSIIGCGVKNQYLKHYKKLRKICRKYSVYAFRAPIVWKEKCKALAYLINPFWAAKCINRFRKRKFTKATQL